MTIARITRTHGVRGEVVAFSLTDFPERFDALERVRIENQGRLSWVELEGFRFHKGRVLLKFVGLERPEQVGHLLGGEVQVPEAERVELPADTYFHSDLIGCRVFLRERLLGKVAAVIDTGSGAILEIASASGEILIPLAKRYLRRIVVEEGLIEIDAPEELIELNQPAGAGKGRGKERETVRATTRSKRE